MGLICQQQILHFKYLSCIINTLQSLIYGTKFIYFMFALVRLSFSFSPFPPALVSPLKKEMSCTQPSDKHQRAQIITWWFPEKPGEWKSWGQNRPFTSPRFPAAASVRPWQDSVGLSEAHVWWPNTGSLAPESCSPKFAVIIIKKSWAGSVASLQTF